MTPAIENWRPVLGYEGLYEVSDQGRVRSVDRVVVRSDGVRRRFAGRLLAQYTASRSHGMVRRTVALSRSDRPRTRYVHALVMEAFVGPRPSGMEVCHGNGDATDNRLANLRYDTHSANTLDRVRHGVHHQAVKTKCSRGHRLSPPNLVPHTARQGRRDCLACDRGRRERRRAERRNLQSDMQAAADAHYGRIMAN